MSGSSSEATRKVIDEQTNAMTNRRNSSMMPFVDSLIDKAISIVSALDQDWRASITGEQLAQLVQFGEIPATNN